MDIRNVYCVGRNYRQHAAELGNEVPTSPMLFLKPSHAVVPMVGGELAVAGGRGAVHFETELVFRVGAAYRPGIAPDELFTEMTVGLDLTLRDVQDGLKAKGQPWLPAKGFRQSAPIGRWIPFPGMAALATQPFGLLRNGQEAQRGRAGEMVFDLPALIAFVGQAYGIGPGDLLFTGTPAGVDALQDGDELAVWWGEQTLGRTTIRLVR